MIMVSCAVIVGIILGYFTKSHINFDISLLIQFGLYLLLFFIGIDIGKNDNILNDLKKLNKKVLFLPFITIISSLAGGAVASIFLSLSIGESVAVSAGMGWYSFSAIELSKVSVELGGIAFLSNIFRELLAIFLIPIIAKTDITRAFTPNICKLEISLSSEPILYPIAPSNKYNDNDCKSETFFNSFSGNNFFLTKKTPNKIIQI